VAQSWPKRPRTQRHNHAPGDTVCDVKTVATAKRWVDIPDDQFDELVRRLRKRGYGKVADFLLALGKVGVTDMQVVVDTIQAWSIETDGLGLGEEIMRLRYYLVHDILTAGSPGVLR
jgi:hypothetical protein